MRFYRAGRGPWSTRRSFGPLPDARFDHHRPPLGEDPERSVWYAGRSLAGALAEAFGRVGFLDRGSDARVVVAEARSPFEVIDLVGMAARRLGLDQRVGASTDYPNTQAWARSFYERYPELAGIRWRGRQAGSICAVLDDRAAIEHLEARADLHFADPAVWPRIARAARRAQLKVV